MEKKEKKPKEQVFEFFVEPENELNTIQNLETWDDEESDGESCSLSDSEFGTSNQERVLKVRLDKWLWAARFFKTRAVARAAVEKGKVFYNGERSKPSREIELGATLQIRHGRFEKTVIVKGLSTRRRSTEEALQLFEETEDSRLDREQSFDWQPPHVNHFSARGHEQRPYENRSYNRDPGNSYNRAPGNAQYREPGNSYNPYPQQSGEANPYGQGAGEPRERRIVRFLRRSFVRNEDNTPNRDPNRQERPQNPNPYRNPEFESYD